MSKLLIVGVDAGSPELFDRWIRSGDMPTLAKIQREGAWGRVANPYGLEAGAVWPVFHCGLSVGRHPQYDGRRYFDPKDYGTRWYGPEQTATPFWRQLSDQGLRCLLLDPPYVHLDPEINGRMVVDWGGHVPADGQNFRLRTVPESLRERILSTVGPAPAADIPCDDMSPESVEDYLQFRDRYLSRIEKRGELAEMLLKTGDWDFALISSTELHCAGHHLWHVNDNGHPNYRPELESALGAVLRDCYRAFDRSLAQILRAVDEDTTVLLFGSHGMGPQYSGTGLLDRILLALDRGTPARRPNSLKSRLRKLWHRIPVEQRARLRRLRQPFAGSLHPPRFLGDHSNRRFFEVYANNASGGIRINLRGRECDGVVNSDEYESLVNRICNELREIINVETGTPLIGDVVITKQRYSGEYVDSLPDILVCWNRSAPIRRVYSPRIGMLEQETVDNRTGDHTPDGVFYAFGTGVSTKGAQPDVRPQDFAATVARFFNKSCQDIDGQPISTLTPSVARATRNAEAA